MERLTNSDKEIPTLVNNAEYWLEVYFKLKDIEDAEEQGLLLRLPCKVGDTLYCITPYVKEPIIAINIYSMCGTMNCIASTVDSTLIGVMKMGRLIDADKLKADLEKAISKNEDMDCLDFLLVAFVIDAQPTAYDPDKVVEQLEKEKNPIYREDGSLMGERTVIRIDKVIEIVKGGGVDVN